MNAPPKAPNAPQWCCRPHGVGNTRAALGFGVWRGEGGRVVPPSNALRSFTQPSTFWQNSHMAARP